MRIPPVEFLIWAKRHQRVRYEMTVSGAPPADWSDIAATFEHVESRIRGADGDPRMIEAVALRYGVDPGGVVPVPGTSGGNFVVLASMTDRTRPILIEHPVYPPIRRAAAFFNSRLIDWQRPVERNFAVDMDQLRANLEAGAGTVVLTNLHNPSGQVIPRDQMARIASLCGRYDALLVVDEVYLDYEHVNLGGPRWTAANLADNVVVVNSLTKVYGYGALRAGWIITTPARARHARRMMDYLNVEHPAPATSLALRAMAYIERLEARTRELYRRARPIVERWVRDEPRLHVYPNHGALFECVRLPAGVAAGRLCRLLVREYATRVVPGEFFGMSDHIRVSTTLEPDDLARGLDNISRAVDRLTTPKEPHPCTTLQSTSSAL